MIDWEVLDDQPLPDAPDEPRPPRLARWLPWGLLLLLLLVGGLWLRHTVQDNEAQRRADVQRVVEVEAVALREGLTAQIAALADPTARDDWRLRYRALFELPAREAPAPAISGIEHERDLALVTLRYEGEAATWQALHAYRLVRSAWRRTPVPPDRWGEPQPYRSATVTLWFSPRDAAALPPDEFLAFLEGVRRDFAAAWPGAHDEPLTLRVAPHDLEPAVLPTLPREPLAEEEASTLWLNSPLVAREFSPYLDPPRAYRLAVAVAVAERLAPPPHPATSEEAALVRQLQAALVRHLVLDAHEQARYRKLLSQQLSERRGSDPRIEGPRFALLADYLIATEGAGAPARLARALGQSRSLGDATVQAFGLPLTGLLDEVTLWQRLAIEADAPARPRADDRPTRATLLRVLDGEPLRAVTMLDGALAEIELDASAALPVPLPCLGTGTQFVFQARSGATGRLRADELRVETLRLPSWFAVPLPDEAHVLVTRSRGTTQQIVALSGDSLGETALLTLPGDASIVPAPTGGRFAFLHDDRCGTSVNRYDPTTGRVQRITATLEGEGHLFWLHDQLYLLDDASQGAMPHWTIALMLQTVASVPVEVTVAPGQEWDTYLTYDLSRNRHLVRLADGSFQWLDVLRRFSPAVMRLSPADDLPLPAGATLLAAQADSGWLAVSTPLPDARFTELTLRQVSTGETRLIDRIPLDAAYQQVALAPSTPPEEVAVVSPASVGAPTNLLQHIRVPAAGGSRVIREAVVFEGRLTALHLCADGRVLVARDSAETGGQLFIGGGAGLAGDAAQFQGEVLSCL